MCTPVESAKSAVSSTLPHTEDRCSPSWAPMRLAL